MDKFVEAVVFGTTVGCIVLMAHWAFKTVNTIHTVKYDCRLAEISVDYPQQVKELCRKHMRSTDKDYK